ncbi:MAG: 3-hydroxybutyryl-CoA dehydrogenase [Firmicutes bacterium]|nr:3-hydroxybutyryl-CoA dehydrogenase [Bacillota bacterium]
MATCRRTPPAGSLTRGPAATKAAEVVGVREVRSVAVIGAGTMGSGIAQLAAASGFGVTLVDVDLGLAERGCANIERRLARAVERGQLTAEEREQALARVRPAAGVDAAAQADFVVEAVVEDLEVKKATFRALDALVGEDVVLATNTSSMSITEIGAATRRPERVVGMHFFNPAPVMRLVEVIHGYATHPDTVAAAMDLARRLGRTPIEVRKDSPGFIVNRILIPLIIEACKVVEEGLATAEDVDTAITLGLNHPMGPLTLLDFTGVDVNQYVMDYFFSEFRQPQYATPRLIRELVRAGRLGRKVGHGVYDYDPATGRRLPPA